MITSPLLICRCMEYILSRKGLIILSIRLSGTEDNFEEIKRWNYSFHGLCALLRWTKKYKDLGYETKSVKVNAGMTKHIVIYTKNVEENKWKEWKRWTKITTQNIKEVEEQNQILLDTGHETRIMLE